MNTLLPDTADIGQRTVFHAFGLALRIDSALTTDGLGDPMALVPKDLVDIRHDPDELDRVWHRTSPRRTRDVRGADGELLLAVDHDDVAGYLLNAPNIGRALVCRGGHTVLCAPTALGLDWEALLVGQLLPLVATVRGVEVIHAAGVVLGGRAHLLCAEQGIGKTTLAAHLVAKGAELLSDDVVAVDSDLCAYPGCTVLSLRPESGRALAPLQRDWRRLADTRGKQRFLVECPRDPAPLGGIYLLERGGLATIEQVVTPSLVTLLATTFNLSVRSQVRLRHHLDLCATIAERVPVFRVGRDSQTGPAELAAVMFSRLTGST